MMITTGFSTRSSRRLLEALVAALLFALACAFAPARAADTIEVRDAQLDAQDESFQLAAEFAIELNPRLEEAINRGVPLYFNLEFELTRPRWYWFDDKPVQLVQPYKLTYHALTRQYRLSAGTLYQSFATLTDALRVLARPRLTAFERARVRPGESYVAAVRLRLDVSQLPRAFQLSALTSRDWTLESEWRRFPFRAEPPAAPK